MASNTRQPLIVETVVPCIPQALRKYWLTSGKGLEGQRPGFCRGHAHILQIAGDLARSAFMAGMSKTEEAEHRKGLTGTGGRTAAGSRGLLTKSPCLQGPGHCLLARVLNRGHSSSRFLGELEVFSLHSTFIPKTTPTYIPRDVFDGCREKSPSGHRAMFTTFSNHPSL